MKMLTLTMATMLLLSAQAAGAVIQLNDGFLFTAPALTDSPFNVRLIDMEGAPDVAAYNIFLNIVGPAGGGMHWDEFGTAEGSHNIFTGKDAWPFMAFVLYEDAWTIDISFELTYPADAVVPAELRDQLAVVSVNGGTTFEGWKVTVDPDSYLTDSSANHYDITGAPMPIIQPEPATISLLSVAGLLILKRRRK